MCCFSFSVFQPPSCASVRATGSRGEEGDNVAEKSAALNKINQEMSGTSVPKLEVPAKVPSGHGSLKQHPHHVPHLSTSANIDSSFSPHNWDNPGRRKSLRDLLAHTSPRSSGALPSRQQSSGSLSARYHAADGAMRSASSEALAYVCL